MCKVDGPTTKILLAQLRCTELGLHGMAEAFGSDIKAKIQNIEDKNEAEG